MSTHQDSHLDDLRMQADQDGELPAGETARVRAPLDVCPRCRRQVEAWETLFHDLDGLPALSPSPAFRERIMTSVELPSRRLAGVRSLLGREGARRGSSEHVDAGRLQDFLEGTLAARVSTRVEEHLADCAVCRSELAAFREVGMALSGLPRFDPSPGFAEGVMAGLRVRQMAQVVMAPTSRLERLAEWARSLAPS